MKLAKEELNFKETNMTFKMKTYTSLLGILTLLLSMSGVLKAQEVTTPQDISISCEHPTGSQSGLVRPYGDGNTWTFKIVPAANVHWVSGPTWQYPDKDNETNSDWGQWGGGDGQTWLSWVSPNKSGTFAIKVTGKITCGNGGDGEPIDIEADWSGKIPIVELRPTKPNENSGSIVPIYAPGSTSDTTNQTPISVCAGEEVVFSIKFKDTDYKKVIEDTSWSEFDGLGPYKIVLNIVGDATFDSIDGDITKTINGSDANNVKVLVKTNAFSTGRPNSITVTATLKDEESTPQMPITGSAKDNDFTWSWTLVKRPSSHPTSMEQIVPSSPFGQWRNPTQIYTYQMKPNDPNISEYNNQIVQEEFGIVTAYGFTTDDLTDEWKTENNDIDFINDPQAINKVAQRLFNSGVNGSFVINSQDQIQDIHQGMGSAGDDSWASAFKPSAWRDEDGFGYALTQTYLACGDTVGTYTITRAVGTDNNDNAILLVRKSGP